MAELLDTELIRPHALPEAETGAPNANFPALSQADHPTLGTPCWYIHPCETPTALRELVDADDRYQGPEEGRPLRQLELWLLLIGNVMDVRS